MAQKTRDELKSIFINGAVPDEDDFADVFDSFTQPDELPAPSAPPTLNDVSHASGFSAGSTYDMAPGTPIKMILASKIFPSLTLVDRSFQAGDISGEDGAAMGLDINPPGGYADMFGGDSYVRVLSGSNTIQIGDVMGNASGALLFLDVQNGTFEVQGAVATLQGALYVAGSVRLSTVAAYPDDTAAGAGGLTTGDLWQTAPGNTLSLPPGVLMVKQ